MDNFFQDYSALFGFLTIGAIVLYLAIVIAILKLPKIAKYEQGQLKLMALMAKKNGIEVVEIRTILVQSDKDFESDIAFETMLTGKEVKVTLTPQGEIREQSA